MSRKVFVYFIMSWDCLFLERLRIHVNIVIGSGSNEHAAELIDPLQQFGSFHIDSVIVLISCSSGTSSITINM
jgi:hypothetical protein